MKEFFVDSPIERYQIEQISKDLSEFISTLTIHHEVFLPDRLSAFELSFSRKDQEYDRFYFLKLLGECFFHEISDEDIISFLFILPPRSKKMTPDKESIMENLSTFFRGWILMRNVNPACGNHYAIKWAARNDYKGIIEILLKHYPESDFIEGVNTALLSAGTANNLELVKFLEEKIKPDPVTMDLCIKSTKNLKIILHLVKDDIKLLQTYIKHFRETTTFYASLNVDLKNNSINKLYDGNFYSKAVTILEGKLEEMEKEAAENGFSSLVEVGNK